MTIGMAVVIGLVIGAPIGFFACAVLSINRRDDDFNHYGATSVAPGPDYSSSAPVPNSHFDGSSVTD